MDSTGRACAAPRRIGGCVLAKFCGHPALQSVGITHRIDPSISSLYLEEKGSHRPRPQKRICRQDRAEINQFKRIFIGMEDVTSKASQDPEIPTAPVKMPQSTPEQTPESRPKLTLSAFRRPEQSIRLTNANPRVRMEDHYDLHATGCGVLGHGAFSTVRLAVRRRDGLLVAVKSIAKHDALRSRRLRVGGQRYLEEWEILRQMKEHPYIITLLDLFESDEEIQLVFEYCIGGELFASIKDRRKRSLTRRRGTWTEKQAASITSQVLKALRDLHKRGVVHRDVKPENILIATGPNADDDQIHVKLCDFGMARSILREGQGNASPATPARQRAFSIVGSNFYVAPEVHHGNNYDAAVDIYSLGVTLYILLCGFPPVFSGSDVNPTVLFPSSYWKGISDEAKELVREMMNPDAATRIAAAAALRSEWIVRNLKYVTSPAKAARRASDTSLSNTGLDLDRLYRSLNPLRRSPKRAEAPTRSPARKRRHVERRSSSALMALADLYRASTPPRARLPVVSDEVTTVRAVFE